MRKHRYSKAAVSLLLVLSLMFTLGIGTFAKENNAAPEPELIVSETHTQPCSTSFDFTEQASQDALLQQAEDLPAAFDLRDQNNVTPVKLQNPFGTCWAFAAIAAAETSLLSSGLAATDGLNKSTLDLSEKHLALFVTSSIQDKSSPQYGEGYIQRNDESLVDRMNRGGFPFLATTLFASGGGPVLESENPQYFTYKGQNGNIDYRTVNDKLVKFSYSDDDDWSIPDQYRTAASYSLKESYILPTPVEVEGETIDTWKVTINEAKLTAIKQQIYAGRGMQIGFLADQSNPNDEIDASTSLNPETFAHYGTAAMICNHAVTIVGWDDNYDKSNFLAGKQPPGNGAWLVKNSWGSGEEAFPNNGGGDWGIKNDKGEGTGYFWLSYYDNSYDLPEALSFEKADPNEMLIAHDYLPADTMNAVEYKEEARFANIFTAEHMETLNKIAFYTTHPGTSVSYEIFILDNDYSQPDEGVKVAEGDLGSFAYGGFHKVALEKAFPLLKGQMFSIVLTEKTADGQYTICTPLSHDTKDYKAVINEHESMVYKNGEWRDLSEEEIQKELSHEDGVLLDPTVSLASEVSICDNFGIKGYAVKQAVDGTFSISGISSELFYTVLDHTTMKAKLNGVAYDPENPGKDVDWKIVWNMTDGDEFAVLTPTSASGLKAKLALRKDNGFKTGEFHLKLDVYADETYLGSIYKTVSVGRQSIEGIYCTEKDKKGNTLVYEYDGTAHEPAVEASAYGGYNLVRDRDYFVSYKNNVKCGVGVVTGTTNPENGFEESSADTYFPIRPAKAELKTVTAGATTLSVTVAEQESSGISGYEIQYREKGTDTWKAKKIPVGKALTVTGVKAGVAYDVRVRAYVEIPNYEDYYGLIKGIYYGDFSDTLPSGIVLPAKAIIKKLTVGKKQLTVQVKDQKKTGIAGYEIQYRRQGTSTWKTKTISAKKTKVTLKKLKKGKKYQVRVRGFVKVNGTKQYGAFSKTKTSKKIQ